MIRSCVNGANPFFLNLIVDIASSVVFVIAYSERPTPKTHHEIEWFFPTTVGRCLDTTMVVRHGRGRWQMDLSVRN